MASSDADTTTTTATFKMEVGEAKRWFPCFQAIDPEKRKCRLVCFPWAGSNGMVFRYLSSQLACNGIEVSSLMLPGRSTRLREPLIHNMNCIVGK
jgi:hypothetical protein